MSGLLSAWVLLIQADEPKQDPTQRIDSILAANFLGADAQRRALYREKVLSSLRGATDETQVSRIVDGLSSAARSSLTLIDFHRTRGIPPELVLEAFDLEVDCLAARIRSHLDRAIGPQRAAFVRGLEDFCSACGMTLKQAYPGDPAAAYIDAEIQRTRRRWLDSFDDPFGTAAVLTPGDAQVTLADLRRLAEARPPALLTEEELGMKSQGPRAGIDGLLARMNAALELASSADPVARDRRHRESEWVGRVEAARASAEDVPVRVRPVRPASGREESSDAGVPSTRGQAPGSLAPKAPSEEPSPDRFLALLLLGALIVGVSVGLVRRRNRGAGVSRSDSR